jgi:hypothetical protein
MKSDEGWWRRKVLDSARGKKQRRLVLLRLGGLPGFELVGQRHVALVAGVLEHQVFSSRLSGIITDHDFEKFLGR